MEAFLKYVDEYKEEMEKEEEALANSDRKDEATFAKIRANIADVCKTVVVTLKKVHPTDYEAMCLKRMDDFEQIWTDSMNRAHAHNDAEKEYKEAIKLETLCRIRNEFRKIVKTEE